MQLKSSSECITFFFLTGEKFQNFHYNFISVSDLKKARYCWSGATGKGFGPILDLVVGRGAKSHGTTSSSEVGSSSVI